MSRLKHLLSFSKYVLNEQALDPTMGADPLAGGGQAPIAPKEEKYIFIFMEDEEIGDHRYPDGSSSKNFSTYEIKRKDLNNWIDKNVVDTASVDVSDNAAKIKQDAVRDYITGRKGGISPEDMLFVEKFRNAIVSDIEGRQIEDTEVIFSPGKGQPTTDNIEVTFIKVPN